MGPLIWSLASFKGSEVWAIGLCRVHEGYKGSPFKGPSKGACNYPYSPKPEAPHPKP